MAKCAELSLTFYISITPLMSMDYGLFVVSSYTLFVITRFLGSEDNKLGMRRVWEF
ncbi:hypothetical protein HanIR_Chr14g0708181 [Helianthus annuus]|nr:hypothetical protein HanIR_Chr14g0708181 [Helianthus annuus]